MFLKSTKFFFLASLGLLVFLTIFLLWPSSTLAIKLGIPIAGKTEVSDLGEYLATFYRYFIGIIGILATVMVMFGGFRWITAAGSPERIKEAKSNIWSAIIAVVLMLCSYLILNLINPALVQLQLTTGVTPITDIKDMCADKTPCNTRDAKSNCIGKWCPDKGGLPQTCILKDEKARLYKCEDLSSSCTSEKDLNKCGEHSDLGKDLVCRRSVGAGCLLKPLLKCPSGSRVDCKQGDCLNPAGVGGNFCGPMGSRLLCRNKAEVPDPAKGMDAICCKETIQGTDSYYCQYQ